MSKSVRLAPLPQKRRPVCKCHFFPCVLVVLLVLFDKGLCFGTDLLFSSTHPPGGLVALNPKLHSSSLPLAGGLTAMASTCHNKPSSTPAPHPAEAGCTETCVLASPDVPNYDHAFSNTPVSVLFYTRHFKWQTQSARNQHS